MVMWRIEVMPRAPIALLIVVVAAAGCTPVDYGFGETHRQNIALQVVDPDPQYAEEDVEGGNGERSAEAVNRYREGQVKQPATVSTSQSATSSSSSGGGGPN